MNDTMEHKHLIERVDEDNLCWCSCGLCLGQKIGDYIDVSILLPWKATHMYGVDS